MSYPHPPVKVMIKLLLVLVLSTATLHVNAIELYAGSTLSSTSSRSALPNREVRKNFHNTAISLILGGKVFPDVYAELRITQDISTIDYPTIFDEIRNTYKLETSISAVLKNDIFSKKSFSLYSLVGVTNLVARFKNTGIYTESDPITGASVDVVKTNTSRTSDLEPGIGLGIEHGINKDMSLRLEYYKIFDDDRLHDLTAVNLGATYAF